MTPVGPLDKCLTSRDLFWKTAMRRAEAVLSAFLPGPGDPGATRRGVQPAASGRSAARTRPPVGTASPRRIGAGPALCALALIALVAAAAPAAGQEGATPIVETDLRFVQGLPLHTMQEVYGSDDGQCPGDPTGQDPGGRFTPDPGGSWFRFREDETENACGEAQFDLRVPAGASVVRVRFEANRLIDTTVDQSVLQIQSAILQRLYLYDNSLDGHLAEFTYYDDDDGSSALQRGFERDFELIEDQERLTLGWLFHDQGTSQGGNAVPVDLGQAFSSTVRDVELEFLVLGVDSPPVDVIPAGRDVQGDRGQEYYDAVVDVPAPATADLSTRLLLSISNRYQLESAQAPDGSAILAEELESRESQGILEVTLSEEVTEKYGEGLYELHFSKSFALGRTPALLAVFVLMLALPLVIGFFATRSVLGFSSHAQTGRYRRTARLLQVLLGGLWASYGIATAWILINQELVTAMNVWPMEGQAALYYLLLLMFAIGFAIMTILSGRHLLQWMQNDLLAREEAQKELERSNRELEQFAYVASHDLQEPLRMVTHYTKLLEMRYGEKLDTDAHEFIGFATDGATRMKQLIDGLLTYSRVGRTEVGDDPVDMSVMVQRALMNLRIRIQDKGAEVTTGKLPKVPGDPTMLTELMQNLIENGIKYAREGTAPKVHVHAQRDGNRGWRFTVQDNGIGIAPKHHARIFQLFQRLHGRDAYTGTGIGLAICHRIVDLHGGRIWVESTPGKGAAFHFTIPDDKRRTTRGVSAASDRMTTRVPRPAPSLAREGVGTRHQGTDPRPE